MTSEYLWYWSSSEYSASDAASLDIDPRGTGSNYGFRWNNSGKGFSGIHNRVRPVLAF